MQLSVLGRGVLVLGALGVACAPATPAVVAPVAPAAPRAVPTFAPRAVSACASPVGTSTWLLPGGEQLLSSCESTIELRDAASGAVLAQRVTNTLTGASQPIQGKAVSPDGRHVALYGYGHIELRELPTLNRLWTVPAHPGSVNFSPDGRDLEVLGDDEGLTLAVADGRRVAARPTNVVKRWADPQQLNDDETLSVEVGDKTVTIRDARKDVVLHTFERLEDWRHAPFWLGAYVAFHLKDGWSLVDARDPKHRISVPGSVLLTKAVLSNDESWLRTTANGDVLQWRVGDEKPTVLATHRPDRVWPPAAGVVVESTDNVLTVWRSHATSAPQAHHYWLRPAWVEVGPGGQVVVSDSSQNHVLVLGADATEHELAFPAAEAPSMLAFEPSGARFVTAAASKLRVYPTQASAAQQTITLPFTPVSLAWRNESPELLVADAERLYGVALTSGKATPFGDFTEVQRVVVSPNGADVAVVALRDRKPELTLLTKLGTEQQALTSALQDVRFSPDGKALWVLERDSLLTLRLPLSTNAAERARRKPIKGAGYATGLTPTGQVYSTTTPLRLADASGELLPEPQPLAVQPSWPAQGLTLTSGSKRTTPFVVSFPAGVAVVEPPPPNPPKPLTMPELPFVSGDVHAWALNKDRSALATLDGNHTVNTFSTTGGLLARLTESASAIVSSEDASTLAVAADDERSLMLWDTQTWQRRVEVPVPERLNQLALSKDGARVAVLSGAALQVVLADRSVRHYDLRPDMSFQGLAFDPSGEYLAVGGLPLRIVRLTDGAVLYGYAATAEAKAPLALAWVSENGEVDGDLRVLRALAFPNSGMAALGGAGPFDEQRTPHLFEAFFHR